MRFVYGWISLILITSLLAYLWKIGVQISDDTVVLSLVIGASAGIASGK